MTEELLDAKPPWPGYYEMWGSRSESVPAEVGYVGAGGVRRTIVANFQLGVGVYRVGHHEYGLRLAIWDAAYGYVSGFRIRDIAYYVLTRSLSKRLYDWAIDREMKTREANDD